MSLILSGGPLVARPAQPATQALQPSALVSLTNLAGSVSAIQDDPDAPDAAWLTAPSNTAATVAEVAMAAPAGPFAPGPGLQQVRVRVRRNASTSGNGTPRVTVQILEGGVVRATPVADVDVPSQLVVSGTWDGSLIGNPAQLRVRVSGAVGGGGPNRRTVEVGAIRVIATVAP